MKSTANKRKAHLAPSAFLEPVPAAAQGGRLEQIATAAS